MTSEVIIAVRGEMPENLIRTVNQVSKHSDVCLVFDGSENENQCPPKIKNKVRLITIDGAPMGCGYARHVGIDSSTADVIIILDGHMILQKDWHRTIMSHHKTRKNHLTCFRCEHLDQNGRKTGDPLESGAAIRYKSTEKHGLKYALTAKWNAEKPEKGQIPCVLGACYSFRRSWYNAIGKPLSILRAWGGDEEILSLATWVMGGKVYLQNAVAGHIYAAKNKGRIKTADEQDAIWANRYAIVDALPMPKMVRNDLRRWLASSNRLYAKIPQMNAETIELARVLESGPRKFDWLVNNGIITGYEEPADKSYTPPMSPEGDKAQIIIRKADVCNRCGALDSFVQTKGRSYTASFGMSYARCSRCGHKGHLRVVR